VPPHIALLLTPIGWHTGLWEPDGYWDRALVIEPPALPAVLIPDFTEQVVSYCARLSTFVLL